MQSYWKTLVQSNVLDAELLQVIATHATVVRHKTSETKGLLALDEELHTSTGTSTAGPPATLETATGGTHRGRNRPKINKSQRSMAGQVMMRRPSKALSACQE